MHKYLGLWLSRLKTTGAKVGYTLTVVEVILFFINHYSQFKERWMISTILLCAIPLTIIGIFVWAYVDARKEAKAQNPKIELIPSHLPIRDKEGNTIGVEQFYDMNISTLDCLKYKTLEAQLSPISYWDKEKSGRMLLSPSTILWRKENIKPNSFLRKKDIFHFWSTTKQMIIVKRYPIELSEGLEYEADVEVKDDKKTLFRKQYLMRLVKSAEVIGLVIDESGIWEIGGI